MTKSAFPSEISGSIRAPASKSSMQRAVACAALAEGPSLLRFPSLCADSRAALSIAAVLGARVESRDEGIWIGGRGSEASIWKEGLGRLLDCGESGLCLRMFTPIAALDDCETRLEGRGSLLSRPVTAIEGALAALGGFASSSGGLPPVLVRGPLRGGHAVVDASQSSQFLTGLLIALPLAPQDSELEMAKVASAGYIGLTLSTMRDFGVEVEAAADLARVAIRGGQSYRGRDFPVEADWSGAAFLLVAAAIAARRAPLLVSGLDLASAQPDKAIMEALALAGAKIGGAKIGGAKIGGAKIGGARIGGARIGDTSEGDGLLIGGPGRGEAPLRAFDFDARGCPDLFPPLVALAAHCEGVSTFRGAERLRSKESDRAAALSEEFGKLGISVEVEGDLMRVRGGRVGGGLVDSRGDHRIAMAAAVAALGGSGELRIEGAQCVAKSYPEFFEDIEGLSSGRG